MEVSSFGGSVEERKLDMATLITMEVIDIKYSIDKYPKF